MSACAGSTLQQDVGPIPAPIAAAVVQQAAPPLAQDISFANG